MQSYKKSSGCYLRAEQLLYFISRIYDNNALLNLIFYKSNEANVIHKLLVKVIFSGVIMFTGFS